MKELTLTAVYEEAEEGGFIGYIAELPGANTQGETLEEVRENLVEAVQFVLDANQEDAERRLSKDAKVASPHYSQTAVLFNEPAEQVKA